MSINYSDGDIEKVILQLLKKETNLSSSNDIQKENYANWPIKYHLSSIRHNSIRHLDFTGLKVLELGAGMGAMSRYLAEQAEFLQVVEGTEARFACLKERLRDLNNWQGTVCNYQDFKSDVKFDVVCFFGVLEYAGKYINEVNPFDWAINFAKSFLKDDGILLISIENKIGLKYFSGAREDHYGMHFTGICGYPHINSTKTFSKKEMSDMLYKAGFAKVDTHHLFPDYKLTRAVLSDEFIQDYPSTSADIMGELKSHDNGANYKQFFPDPLAAISLAKSGILGEFSNSFLFIAQNMNDSALTLKLRKKEVDNALAFLYTVDRKRNVTTSFIKEADEINVLKHYTHDSDNNILLKEKLLHGEKLSTLLFNLAYFNIFSEFINLLTKHFETVFSKYSIGNTNFLLPEAFDCITKNTMLKDNEFYFFDFEYNFDFELKKSHFIYRNLIELTSHFNQYEIFQHFTSFEFESINEFYAFFCKKLNVEESFEDDRLREITILKHVLDKNTGL